MRGTSGGGEQGDGSAGPGRPPGAGARDATARHEINDAVEMMSERFAVGTAFGATGTADPDEQRQAVVAGAVDAALAIADVTGIEVDPRDLLAAAITGAGSGPSGPEGGAPDGGGASRRGGRRRARRGRSATLARVAAALADLGRPALAPVEGTPSEVGQIAARRRRARYFGIFLEPAAPDFWARWRDALGAEGDRLEAEWRAASGGEVPEWVPDTGLPYPLSEKAVDLAQLSAEIGEQWEFRRDGAEPKPPPPPEEQDSPF